MMRKALFILLTNGTGCLLMLAFSALLFWPKSTEAKSASAGGAQLLWPQSGFPRDVRNPNLQPVTPAHDSVISSSTVEFGDIQVIISSAYTTDLGTLARELALAMYETDDMTFTASLCNSKTQDCSDPAAVAVLGSAPGTWFPTRGRTFALLTTGRITDIINPVISSATVSDAQRIANETLNGLKNRQNHDLVQLNLTLYAPLDAKCLSFDYTFYTADIYSDPNVASCIGPYGDTFTVQYQNANLGLKGGYTETEVVAPGNFIVNQQGITVAAYTMLPLSIYTSLNSIDGSHTADVFPLLQARQAVSGGERVDLSFTIQDIGDSQGNSAVALDNFEWITDTTKFPCPPGQSWSGDRDGDGLPNGWEIYGAYFPDRNGEMKKVMLPKMGANPDIKDVFVEIDAMDIDPTGQYTDAFPLPIAISRVVYAFANAPVDYVTATNRYQGIQLHVDYGRNAPRAWYEDGNEVWGDLSDSDILTPARQYICDALCQNSWRDVWQEVKNIQDEEGHFAPERNYVFHYALFAHKLAKCSSKLEANEPTICEILPLISGASSNLTVGNSTIMEYGASNFVVTLGHKDWLRANREIQQAGTFMHELGHNLALNHSGLATDTLKYKPNHLSVMNYLYQTHGLVVTDTNHKLDYLRYTMITLDEDELWEEQGLYLDHISPTIPYSMGVRYHCYADPKYIKTITNAHTVDWNCKYGIQPDKIKHNISGDFVGEIGPSLQEITSPLNVSSEWDKLLFTGGMLNRQRRIIDSPVKDRSCTIISVGTSPVAERQGRQIPPIGEQDTRSRSPVQTEPSLIIVPKTTRYPIEPDPALLPPGDGAIFDELIPEVEALILR